MKIIEKPWEKENLGVSCAEYIFEKDDDIEQLDFSVLQNTGYEYKVGRIPAGRMDIAYKLQNTGFQFAESTVELKCFLKDLTLPDVYKRFVGKFSYREAVNEEMERIENIIQSGLYDNDRISLDPHFGIDQSAKRFKNWLISERNEETSKVYIVFLDQESIGYFALKNISEAESSSIQAGLFDKERMTGFGFATLYSPMLQAKREKKKMITTAVSSNNLISVKTHMSLGYQLTGMKYVFIKHEQ